MYFIRVCDRVFFLALSPFVTAASGKLDVQRTATATGRRNCAVNGPETCKSLPTQI